MTCHRSVNRYVFSPPQKFDEALSRFFNSQTTLRNREHKFENRLSLLLKPANMNTMTIDVATYLTMKQDLDKLKKENENLKEFAMNVHNFAYGTTYNDHDIMDSVADLNDILHKLKKDEDTANEDLRDEIKELLDVIKALKEDLKETEEDTANEELEYLKKEHEKLKKKHEKLAVEFDELEEVASEIDDLDEQIEKLEKDNDKLEKEVSVLLAVASGNYNRADDFKALCKERFEEEFIDACDDDTLVGQYFTE